MLKKVLALLVASVMIIALATACKPKPAATTAPASGTAAKTTAKTSATAAPGATTVKPTGSATTAPSGADTSVVTEAPTPAPVLPTAQDYIPTAPPVLIDPSVQPTTPPNWTRPPERAIDLKGRTVEYRGHYLTINAWLQANTGDPTNAIDKLNADRAWVEQKFNFKFYFNPYVTSGWRVTTNFNEVAMSGGDWADVAWVQSRVAFPVQVVRNLVKPLDTSFDFVNDPVYNNRFMRSTALWKGRVYGLAPGVIGGVDLGIGYNRAIINAMGLQDPIALYNEGNWNWDTFFNLCIQATRDTNNDGVIEQWGYAGDAWYTYEALVYSNGGAPVTYDKNTQTFSLTYEKPAAMKALLKLNDMVNNLKVVRSEDFMAGNGALYGAGSALFNVPNLLNNALGTNKVVMAFPVGPDNPKGVLGYCREINYYAWTSTIGDDWQDVITATSWAFTRGVDWIRWPQNVTKEALYDKAAWITAARPTYPMAGNVEHLAYLMFDLGVEVIDSPAWANEKTIIVNSIAQKIMYQGVPVITALDMHRDECIAMLNSDLAL